MKRRLGLTALVTVMVLGSVALLTSIVIALRGAGEVDLGLTSLHGQQADVTLMGCGEEALIRLSRNQTFAQAGSVQTTIGNGVCTIRIYEVQGASLPIYTIEMKAERGKSIKCASMNVIVPSMQIAGWNQVPCTFPFGDPVS